MKRALTLPVAALGIVILLGALAAAISSVAVSGLIGLILVFSATDTPNYPRQVFVSCMAGDTYTPKGCLGCAEAAHAVATTTAPPSIRSSPPCPASPSVPSPPRPPSA